MSPASRQQLLNWSLFLFLTALLSAISGCATGPRAAGAPGFNFAADTLSFSNEMHWVYEHDETGQWGARDREPPPTYALRCFPLVRATREFAYHAEFAPDQPRRDEPFYASVVREILARNSRRASPEEGRVVVPGFANLKEFSAAWPGILKAACGTPAASYLQRGNWRVVFPFTRRSQARTAARLQKKLARGELPIVHLTEFPMLNHGLLVYGVREEEGVRLFDSYDPNTPDTPVVLQYHPPNRSFVLPRTPYFHGGDVNVYEVYTGWIY